jgi:flagellar basal-body rod protein FlgB
MKLFDTTLTRLERSLDVRLVRQNVLAGNLANVDTPGFAPKEVDFAAAMASVTGSAGGGQLTTTDVRHITAAGDADGTAEVQITNAAGESPTMDGNRVDLDRTMVAMAENGIQYAASARAAGKKLGILRYVASDGAA